MAWSRNKKLGLKESDVYNPKDILARILTPYIYAQPDILLQLLN